jgi:predicted alpha/beta superfamily hydrolase
MAILTACNPSEQGTGTQSGSLDDPSPSPYLDGVESRLVTSAVTGRTYQISVALPRGYDTSDETYPVLYAVDANGEFGTVVEAARLLRFEESIPELLIVGIGYPVGRFFDAAAPRAVDLTPTEDRDWERQQAEDFPEWPAPEGSGGAPAFLEFLRQELIPSIDAEFRTKAGDRALFGHSFGGLFAVHALLNGEETFQRFIAGSPSLWWDGGVTFRHEEEYAATHRALRGRVFFSIGELEEQNPEIYWGHMVTDLQRFVEAVEARQYEGLEYESHLFEDETHTSVIPATISRGLRYIYPE